MAANADRQSQRKGRLRVQYRQHLGSVRLLGADEELAIVRAYDDDGAFLYELADAYQVSTGTIRNTLLRHGRTPRTRVESMSSRFGNAACKAREYTLNEGAFDGAEQSPEAAYWVGFLMADGCVYQQKNGTTGVVLSLAVGDSSHVGKFRAFLGAGHPIRFCRPGQAAMQIPLGPPA